LFDSLGIWFKARVCCVAWIFEVDGWVVWHIASQLSIDTMCTKNMLHIQWVSKIQLHSQQTLVFLLWTHSTWCCMLHVPKWPIYLVLENISMIFWEIGNDMSTGKGQLIVRSIELDAQAA
jgi:hypothetical protein